MLAATMLPMQVLLVDDDPWTRGGVVAALGADDRLRVQARTVAEALRPGRGGIDAGVEPDALIIDVCVRSDPCDRFRGVEVIDRLRRREASGARHRPVLVMVAEPVDPLLAIRVAEAGADEVRVWRETREEDLLGALVDGSRPASLDVASLKEHVGLRPDGRVNTFLAELERDGLVEAFAPGTTQQGSGVPRRRSIALRRRAMEVAGLRPTSSMGARPLQIPSWREVRGFVNAARGIEGRRIEPSGGR